MRRALWETIVDVVSALQPPDDAEGILRVTDVEVDMPIEIALAMSPSGFEVLADAPRTRWSDGIREPRSRLRFRCHESEIL